MSNIEEKLWAYIDGTCTPQEHDEIAHQIVQDEQLRLQYEELLRLHQEFGQLELDEPPMAFTYNVMETIRAEAALKPLKASINARVIRFISVFFILTIVALLIIIVGSLGTSQSAPGNLPTLNISFQNTISQHLNGVFLKCFVLFDVVVALFLTDTWLRRRKRAVESV
ncbi:hypothetical protein C8P68_109119 [Mucilaginibacter yixingensis]|uniref:Uncharacterized protein n=1 Tax=Mucilaginibacter yixingensis TaxID=1295612 RepID=A0A2T5J5S1_9SPHI|nr:hypothetical protein [Mucilaginibacter yixingensis]PTQ93247.1 hypothetical protein C8P68_109119 [Mucilaginibacter yixingensis]